MTDNRFYREKTATPTDEELRKIAYRVNNLIKEIFLPKSILAKALGVERPTLYAWLKGNVSNIRVENVSRLERLEKICNLIPDEIRRTIPVLRFRHIGPSKTSLEELLIDERISPEDLRRWILKDKKECEDRSTTTILVGDESSLSGISSPAFFRDE